MPARVSEWLNWHPVPSGVVCLNTTERAKTSDLLSMVAHCNAVRAAVFVGGVLRGVLLVMPAGAG